ncbi:MAG: hypothetical protein J5486_06225 [Bacteroidaceae bacterium]|nr:hypothetical protein [Bacteroidaceae bacterium]
MKVLYKIFAIGCVCCGVATTFTACDDMLDMGNDDVLYADVNHLTQAQDTVNSFVGILAQLQKIAVRTNLYGELRGDLVSVSSAADADIKDIANFNVGDDNVYNSPRDYYAIINNCNYYLANANITLTEGRYNSERGDTVTFYPFRAEYVAVKSIRAWVYLQLAQIYGENIPLITEPLLSMEDADKAFAESSNKKNLADICRFFITDLEPYVNWFDYPYHGNPGYKGYNGAMPSRMAVLPIQLVLGDLYLWLASYNQDPSLARIAAKYYYDYIDWVPNDGVNGSNARYKTRNTTGTSSVEWASSNFTSGNFSNTVSDYSSLFNTGRFGNSSENAKDNYMNNFTAHYCNEVISALAMDTASAEGHFNDLRYLYGYNHDNIDINAVLMPSDVCYAYSDNQTYYGTYNSGDIQRFAAVSAGMLESDDISKHKLGDLRLWSTLSYSTLGDHDYQSQTIGKMCNYNDIVIYRTGQVYLRLAEALNFAGFPKFALDILTTGLDNNVIAATVLPYCDNATDSAFVDYFNFPYNYYRTAVSRINLDTKTGQYKFTYAYVDKGKKKDSDPDIYNIGLHSRGSGWTPENEFYYPIEMDVPQDSTTFPTRPLWASVWPAYVTAYSLPYSTRPVREDFPNNKAFNDAVAQYEADSLDCETYISNFYALAQFSWSTNYMKQPSVVQRHQEIVDSLIDVEQALETCFEGHRFGDLMRAAYRKGDASYLANKVGARNPALIGTLSDRRNWFISWKGMIGR